MALAKGCQLVIHEAFHKDADIPGHGTVTGAIEMAKQSEALNLALVHIHRKIRGRVIDEIERLREMAGPVNLFVPEPGERIKL